jgi:hypothetical protein
MPVKIVEVAIPATPKKNKKNATTTAPLPLCNFGGKALRLTLSDEKTSVYTKR